MKMKSLLMVILSCFTLLAASMLGQAQRPKFKVGDHVEFSQNSACIGDRFAVRGVGTIVQVNTTSTTMNYVIQFDPDGGGSGTAIVPIRHQDCGIKASAAPQKQEDGANAGGTTAPAHNRNEQPAGNRNTNEKAAGAKFKVNDRVEFS